jgi:hypothetical protein
MLGTRLQGDEWYPVKCDMVAKQVVLDSIAKDGVNVNVLEAGQYQKRVTSTCNSRELFCFLRDVSVLEY